MVKKIMRLLSNESLKIIIFSRLLKIAEKGGRRSSTGSQFQSVVATHEKAWRLVDMFQASFSVATQRSSAWVDLLVLANCLGDRCSTSNRVPNCGELCMNTRNLTQDATEMMGKGQAT